MSQLENHLSSSFKICVLISGGGTTLKNLIDFQRAGNLDAEIACVVSSNPSAQGNLFATENKIPLVTIQRQSFASDADFSETIFSHCRSANIDLVVMGGFLKKLVIPDDFANRVINIHPSLIPAFSGKGFYGMNVHRAVVNYGCKISGCTVHFVDNEYDHGPVIAQEHVALSGSESAETVQELVFDVECRIYPSVINQIADGSIQIHNRIVILKPHGC